VKTGQTVQMILSNEGVEENGSFFLNSIWNTITDNFTGNMFS